MRGGSTLEELFPDGDAEGKIEDALQLLKSLVLMFRAMPPGAMRAVAHAFPRRTAVSHDCVTLVTQMSLDKFPKLVQLHRRWNGPMSVAVYVPNEAAVRELHSLVERTDAPFRAVVTLHVLMESAPRHRQYPINRLRNLALAIIGTEYFFSDNDDFLPSQDAHAYVRRFLAENADPGRHAALPSCRCSRRAGKHLHR